MGAIAFFSPTIYRRSEMLIEEYDGATNNNLVTFGDDGRICIGLKGVGERAHAHK